MSYIRAITTEEKLWCKFTHIIVKDVPIYRGSFPPGGGIVAISNSVELANVPPSHDNLVCGCWREKHAVIHPSHWSVR